MTEWYYAPGGQQQGPCSEAELRSLIDNGTVRPDTMVWTDGMADWQTARDIGLFASASGVPPIMSRQSGTAIAGHPDRLSIDFDVLGFVGRGLLLLIGYVLIIPAPWVATSFNRWIIAQVRVPGRPNLSFTGQPMDIWWVLVLMPVCTWAPIWLGAPYLQYLLVPVQAYLSWMMVRWVVSQLASDGQPLPFSFEGSAPAYVGWNVLLYLSFITIIGWAWVTSFWTNWICRNIQGTRRPVFFNGTGLQILWRTIVLSLVSMLIIPIPWIARWYARWFVSQISLGAPESGNA